MRACVLALAAIAFAQPALARDHSHRHKSHHAARHHHAHHHYAGHRHLRAARVRETPIISGYAMPQSFARTDAADSAFRQSNASLPEPAVAPAFAPRSHTRTSRRAHDGALDAMIARHAAANGVPVDLVHRVVIRESGYNPRAVSKGNYGLMQIRHATARGMGYSGSAAGLLDAETNLTYAVKYLAGAYHAAGGNPGRAVALYARGYHGRGVPTRLARRAAR